MASGAAQRLGSSAGCLWLIFPDPKQSRQPVKTERGVERAPKPVRHSEVIRRIETLSCHGPDSSQYLGMTTELLAHFLNTLGRCSGNRTARVARTASPLIPARHSRLLRPGPALVPGVGVGLTWRFLSVSHALGPRAHPNRNASPEASNHE